MLLCINRHAFEDVWVGLMKHSNSSVWYGAKSSKWVELTITLHGQLFHERQYAVLNMSGPSHSANSNLTYADSCNDRVYRSPRKDTKWQVSLTKYKIIVYDLPLFSSCVNFFYSI